MLHGNDEVDDEPSEIETNNPAALEAELAYEYSDEKDIQADAQEEVEEHASWRHSKWVPVALVAVVLVLGGVAFFATGFEKDIALERIRVEGSKLLTEKQIISLAAIDRGQRFYDIDLKQIAARIDKHALIKAAFPRRETNPATIVLAVEERHPTAIMRSASGETLLIDRDGYVMRPKKLEGLRDPARLIQLPLLSGIGEKDSIAYQAMTKLVLKLQSIEQGAMADAIGELKRTPTGGYLLYTLSTQTPIFLGSPDDQPLELLTEQQSGVPQKPVMTSQFDRQLALLAKAWKRNLQHDIEAHPPLYVDARFQGEIIVKRTDGLHNAPLTNPMKDSTKSLALAQTMPDHQSVKKSQGSGTIVQMSH